MHNRRWLFLIPFLALLLVPLYNREEPYLLGFPFFYWFQIALVPLTAGLTWFAYKGQRDEQ